MPNETNLNRIRILDDAGKVLTELTTPRPEWSFDQFCRNRDIPGARWEGI